MSMFDGYFCCRTFVIGDDASRVGAFRYNRYIDTRSQILLRDYPDNRTQLLEAFDQIPYDGAGICTDAFIQ